jgi:hypothetical protein
MLDEAGNACSFTGCTSAYEDWLSCLESLPKVCYSAEVDNSCSAQAAGLTQCCPSCTDNFMPGR